MSNANVNDTLTVGKYKLQTCIATGQHSQVWEAIDNETSRRCAMKVLLPEAIKDAEQTASLKHEYKVGSSFDHPNIVKYYELSVSRKQAYFAMEMFPAPNLKAHIYNDVRSVQVRLKRTIELVAMALDHIHEKGWVHRDVKPENILMNRSAEVRVIDFSLACRAAGALSKIFARKQATVRGTRTYMAPEQILGKPLTLQTDIYSLGVTLFEILTGQPPFTGSTPKALLMKHVGETAPNPSFYNSNVTEEMDRIVARMLAKKPEQRQKKISEFMAEFRNVTPFKEPVTDVVEKSEEEKAKEELDLVLGERLDSRADALRTKVQGGAPRPAPPPKKPMPKLQPQQKPPAPAAQAPPPMGMPSMPMQGMPMPQGMPGYPPGMPMNPMMPYPMAPMQAPQMPMPQMPAPMPGQGGAPWVAPMPPQPLPAGPAPWQGAPPAAAPMAPPPRVPPVAPPAPRPAAPAAVPQVPAAAIPTVVPRQAAPVPVPPKPAPAKPAAKPQAKPQVPSPSSGDTFKIDDLPGFDDLSPVN